MEKSSLTVERELLQSTSQNSCDSTLNSNEKQPLDGRHSTLNSNEQLPKQKEKQPLDGRHNTLNSSELLPKQPLDGRHNNNDSGELVCVSSFPGEGSSILVFHFRTLMTFFLQNFFNMNLKKASFGSDCLSEGREILR